MEERKPYVDDDNDGVLAKDDCNDEDGTIGPDFPEIYYNGIDENCDGKDDFDQDGDGFVTDEYIGKITQGVPNSGQLQGGDCDDQDGTIHPGAEDLGMMGLIVIATKRMITIRIKTAMS